MTDAPPSRVRPLGGALRVGSSSERTVVAWTPAGTGQERLIIGTLEPHAHVICCRTEPALFDELSRGESRVLVVELGNDLQRCPSSLILAVRERFPHIRMVGYCWLSHAAAIEILLCGRAGLDAVALRGYNDVGQVVQRVIAEEDGAEEVVFLDLASTLPDLLARFVRILLARVQDAPSVEQLARTIGRSPRSLQRVATEHAVCSPRVLIECVRVLLAARLLTHGRLPVRQVALRSGYRTVAALRRAMGRCAVPPPERLNFASAYARARKAVGARLLLHQGAETLAATEVELLNDVHGEPAAAARKQYA